MKCMGNTGIAAELRIVQEIATFPPCLSRALYPDQNRQKENKWFAG
jgi:hypothetical protein